MWANSVEVRSVSGSLSVLLLNTDIRVDAADGDIGTEIDLEDLGLDGSGFFGRAAGRWRPWRTHEFELAYAHLHVPEMA